MTDIRWKQRFSNFIKAYKELADAVRLAQAQPLSKLEKQGAIQGFEYTHELAWNVLKDYLEEQGHTGLIGSKDTSREAFKRGLIPNGEVWMTMIKLRNLTSHTYDQTLADDVFETILNQFYPEFTAFFSAFNQRLETE